MSYSPPSSPTDPSYGLSFLCPTNSENYLCRGVGFDFTYSPGDTYTFSFKKYRQSDAIHKYELPAGATCQATYVSEHFNSATKKFTVTVDNDLNPLQTVSGTPIRYNGVKLHEAASLPPALKQILRKNYYTKYFVYLKLSTTSPTRYKDLYVLPQQHQQHCHSFLNVTG